MSEDEEIQKVPDFKAIESAMKALLYLEPEERLSVIFWFCTKCGERANECGCVESE